jgi:CHAT domain-containing protein
VRPSAGADLQAQALPSPGTVDLLRAAKAPAMGRAEEALAACERALAALPAQSVHQRSQALMRRGLAKRALGDLEGARNDLSAALAVSGIGLPQRLDVSLDLADVQERLGDPASALSTLDALPPGGLADHPVVVMEGSAVRARALSALGRTREAVAAGERAVQAADTLRAPILQAPAHAALAVARRAHGDLPGAIAEGRLAIGLYDQLHASIGDDDAVKQLRAGPDGDAWEHLALALEAAGRPEEARQAREARGAAPARPTQAIADFETFAETLEIEVADLPDRIAVPTGRFASLQQDLREDEALLVPVVLPDRIVVFVVRASGEPTWAEVPVAEDRVAALVSDMRSALQAPDRAWKATRGVKLVQVQQAGDPTAAARELEKLVIAPVREKLAGVTTLVVAPGGRLRYVPFAALTDGERYLVEDYELALLTASGTATTHREIDPKDGVFALANPDGSLPGASAEVQALQKTWGRRATAFDGAAATEEALRSGVAGAGIVHLATHGVLDNERPRESYLLMAGEEARLTLAEISLLPLQDVDLVVLSACETAVGEHGEGKEIAGLAYQFEVRGAASVIASLWSVDDASTSDLMVDLYGGLRKREARAEALRQAQLALLSDPDTAHPYYWAPFILIGDWR